MHIIHTPYATIIQIYLTVNAHIFLFYFLTRWVEKVVLSQEEKKETLAQLPTMRMYGRAEPLFKSCQIMHIHQTNL